MNAPVSWPGTNPDAWNRYIAREHTARDVYLATVNSAHREYLTGPWPDRDSYEHVERSAWITYYAAGREAWRRYTAELTPPPPPPPGRGTVPDNLPVSPESYLSMTSGPDQPTFTPHPEGQP